MADAPKSYCEAVEKMEKSNIHRVYHDTEYGFPMEDDNELFGRLILEINQAGLSWTTILKKQENFRKAYEDFTVEKIAKYKEKDRQRLLNDASIIRNRLKIDATIFNAQKILELQNESGSFKNWLDQQGNLSKTEWVQLFKKTFQFTGGEITNEFLMSTGYLPGAHIPECPVHKKILAQHPKWAEHRD
ncbi:MAG: DNA-3-methyladenine glycosylase I [Bacteroidales bacterium]|nr:DNA-3-methyladenine glycosylase I [Bacteroidales bacterium]